MSQVYVNTIFHYIIQIGALNQQNHEKRILELVKRVSDEELTMTHNFNHFKYVHTNDINDDDVVRYYI